MQLLRANTAVDVLIGPFVDEDDGKTAETGLTITQADVRLSKLGQNIAQKNDANAAAHDELGYHNCPLDTTDTNTEGTLVLMVHESGALPVRHEYMVMAEAAWDSMFVAKDDGFMDVNIKTVGRTDTQETEANNLESACSNYSVTRGLTGTALPAAAAAAAGGIPLSTAGALEMDTLADWVNAGRLDAILDLILADTNELQTDDYPTSIAAVQTTVDAIEVGTITNATGIDVATDVKAIKAETVNILADTDDIGVAGAGLTDLGGMSAGMKAEVQVEADASLASYDPPTKAEMDTAHALLATPAQVNTQVADVIKTDTLGEPAQGAPPATASIEAKVAWLYKFLRNKIDNDGSTIQVYNDAGAVVDHKSTVSEAAGTVTRAEFVSGP